MTGQVTLLGHQMQVNNARVVVGLALSLITAVAGYFIGMHGLNLLDFSRTNAQLWRAKVIIVAAAAFLLASSVNFFYGMGRGLVCPCGGERTTQEEFTEELRAQLGITLMAPIGIPLAAGGLLLCGFLALGKAGR